MKRILFATSCVASLVLSACSDPTLPDPEPDVCARAGACEVRGVDLVVEEVSLAFPANHPIDPLTHMPWVQNGDSVPVRWRIGNRGDKTSRPTEAVLWSCSSCLGSNARFVEIPALEPGQVYNDSAKVLAGGTGASVALTLNASAEDDPFYDNNSREATEHYLVVAPDIRGTIQILSPEVRVGTSLRVEINLRNHARLAVSRGDTLSLCFRRIAGIDSCSVFARHPLPDLPPNATSQGVIEVDLAPEHYTQEKHTRLSLNLDACIDTGFSGVPCAARTQVALIPNLEMVCDVERLTLGVATPGRHTGIGGAACAQVPNLGRYYFFSFEASAGHTYQVEITAPGSVDAGIWTRDGIQVGSGGGPTALGTATVDGRLYVVVNSSQGLPFDYQLTVTEQ